MTTETENTPQVTEEQIQQIKQVYTTEFNRCSVIGWNLSIYLLENDVDLSSLSDDMIEFLTHMKECRIRLLTQVRIADTQSDTLFFEPGNNDLAVCVED